MKLEEYPNITMIVRATGLYWYEITTLIKEHRVPTRKIGGHILVLAEGLPRLIEVLKNYPGVNEAFIRANSAEVTECSSAGSVSMSALEPQPKLEKSRWPESWGEPHFHGTIHRGKLKKSKRNQS